MPGQTGVRMLESTGGGVGVIDFDRDGFPDLFLTQGEDWKLNSEVPSPSDQYRDRLLRNQGDSFQDVTMLSGMPMEGGFGQGCCAGDFNNDGFADLYVANIGANQLLINNGDGTFTDHTALAGLTGEAWTSSCLIADLDNDGNPDLFDVNYVEGKRLFSMVCNEHTCSPQHYTSAQDHLHLANGEGTVRFIDRSKTQIGGPGLGLVAFRVEDESGQNGQGLSLFIANDQQPNFFLRNRSGERQGSLLFEDTAFLSGLAVNHEGRKTACRGVASGDANGDGLLDLFVTNYKHEANNLYLQGAGGLFVDGIGGTGLQHPGIPYVGWGTQFLDADNDGDLDLVVANGHVGEFETEGVEYKMPTQLFANQGPARFDLVPAQTAGEFFGKKVLGRSLATLDWNRDGRMDFVLSSIAAPVALLTNHTEDAGNFVSVRLSAVSTARDAIGSFVSIQTDTRLSRKQLTAGDGFQASNERLLTFGIGSDTSVRKLTIEWPSGLRQELPDLPANATINVVEGSAEPTLWRKAAPLASLPLE
jgi:hypothetical protein